MYERILVPLDGSAAAEAALAFAELIPSRRVRLLAVEPDDRGPMLADAGELSAWRAARECEAHAWLDRVAAPLRRQGREVERAFEFGDPAARILAAAADADLIAMATHGRGAGGRSVFGSVADRVAWHGRVATLVVRGGPRPAAPPPVTRLVVPLDGSPRAERALPVAATLAGDLGVPIRLLRVVQRGRSAASSRAHAGGTTPPPADGAQRGAAGYVERQAGALRNQDLAATGGVLFGPPAPALLGAIGPGDLVVVTTRGRGGVRRWLLGSVAERLVRAAAAPVLLVRDRGVEGDDSSDGGGD